MHQNFDFGDPKYRATSPNFTAKARGKQSLGLQKFFSLPIIDSLTLLPYCKISSRIVDRHLVAVESDHE